MKKVVLYMIIFLGGFFAQNTFANVDQVSIENYIMGHQSTIFKITNGNNYSGKEIINSLTWDNSDNITISYTSDNIEKSIIVNGNDIYTYIHGESASINVCSGNYEPVCGSDNKTYANACVIKNINLDISYHSACTTFVNQSKLKRYKYIYKTTIVNALDRNGSIFTDNLFSKLDILVKSRKTQNISVDKKTNNITLYLAIKEIILNYKLLH